jgi:PEGA domain
MALLARPRELRVASARHAVERLLVCREAPRDGRGELVELLTRRPAPEPRRDVARVGRGALLGVGAGLVCAAGALSAALGDGARRGGSVAATQRPASAVTAASAAGPTPDVRGPDERGAAIAPRGGAGAALAASADAAAGRSLAASAPSHTAARAGKASSTALRQAPALGRLVVAISPWAAVWIDGRPYGETPLQLQLPVGRHRVRLVNHRAARTLTISITATRATLLEQDL